MLVGHIRSIHRYPVKSMCGEDLDVADVGPSGVAHDRTFALRDETAGEIRGGKKWPVLMQCTARYDREPDGAARPVATISLPDGSKVKTSDPECDARLSALIGKSVTLHGLEPASNKQHYRRAQPGSQVLGVLAQSVAFRRMLPTLARLTPAGEELRQDFGREPGEPMPDFAMFPAELIEFVSPPGTYFDAFPIHLVTTATLDELRRKNPGGEWDARRFRPNFVVETNAETTGAAELAWSGRTLRIGETTIECTVATPRCSVVMQAQPGLRKDPSVLRTIVNDASQLVGMYGRVVRAGRVRAGDPVELE